jgi:dihydropteroate synthase
MGVVNVTPDSFSDGGRFLAPESAIAHGRALADEGAAIVDVGGESTRPGAQPVSIADEIARVVPVVEGLARAGICVSIDTRHHQVMHAAIAAGARIVNDVSALAGDRESLPLVARSGAAVVLMHMRGDPTTMQDSPRYDDVVREVADFLARRVAECRAAGIADDRICVDPGIGFGKTLAHNLALLREAGAVRPAGVALLVGASRKSFIAAAAGGSPPSARLPGSLAAALAAYEAGADILRVHDVAETRQALVLWQAIRQLG